MVSAMSDGIYGRSGRDHFAAMGLRIVESDAATEGVIFLVGPPPRREDYSTDAEHYEAFVRRVVQIAARP